MHSHIDDPGGAADFETWNFTKTGDARVLGNYRFDNNNQVANDGIIFRLKRPTGDYRVTNSRSFKRAAVEYFSSETKLAL